MINRKNHQFKLLCLDIDGTLVNDEKDLPIVTKSEIIRVLSVYNLTLILVSARMPSSIDLVAQELNIGNHIIAFNGALVLDAPSENRDIIFNSFLNPLSSLAILDFALKCDVNIGLFRFNEWIVNKFDNWTSSEIKGTKVQPIIADVVPKLNEWRQEFVGPHKILFRENSKKLNIIEQFVKENFCDSITSHRVRETVLEVTPSNTSKEYGIELISKKLKVLPSEIIAIGDNHNDIGMLKYAGLGIAMGNAPTLVKDVANEVTFSNNEDGIAISLKKYF